MPREAHTDGSVTRLEISTPVYLKDDPFDYHQAKEDGDYKWFGDKPMSLFVKNRSISSFCSIQKNVEDDNDSDTTAGIVTGNPLECPFDVFEKFESEVFLVPKPTLPCTRVEFGIDAYEPLGSREISRLISRIQSKDEKTLKSFGDWPSVLDDEPVYFVRELSGKDTIILVGSRKGSVSRIHIRRPCYKELGSFEMKDFLRKHTPLPADQLENKLNHKCPQSQLHVVYEILDSDRSVTSQLFLEFTVVEPIAKELYLNPPTHSRAKVSICPRPGDVTGDFKTYWEDICCLEKLIDLFETDKLSEYHKTYYNNLQNTTITRIEEVGYLVKRIRDLVKQPHSSSWSLDKAPGAPIAQLVTALLKHDRADVDFTDRAWGILKDATSIPALYEAMCEIFATIEGAYWRPYLLPNNNTIFVNMVKDLRSEKLANFRTALTPHLALKMTIEFGMMKFQRDFQFLSIMCQIMDVTEVPKVSTFTDYREGLFHVQKFHCILELLCLARNRVALIQAEHQQFTQDILKQFPEKGPFDWKTIFHFDYCREQLVPLVICMEPVYWNLRLESKSTMRIIQTNIIYTRDIWFPHVQARRNEHDKSVYIAPNGKNPWYRYIYRTERRRP